jgi:hypothetical protein
LKRFVLEDARWVFGPLVVCGLGVGGWYVYDWIMAPATYCYCLF